METIYDQIDSVRRQLLAEADQVVEHVCGELNLAEAAESGEAAPAGIRAAGLAPARAMSVMATQIRSLASMQQEQTAPLLKAGKPMRRTWSRSRAAPLVIRPAAPKD